jgi:hypothetical protein
MQFSISPPLVGQAVRIVVGEETIQTRMPVFSGLRSLQHEELNWTWRDGSSFRLQTPIESFGEVPTWLLWRDHLCVCVGRRVGGWARPIAIEWESQGPCSPWTTTYSCCQRVVRDTRGRRLAICRQACRSWRAVVHPRLQEPWLGIVVGVVVSAAQ